MIKDGLHDSGCSLKVYRAECFNGIGLYGEMHRFIPAVLKLRAFVVSVRVNHRPGLLENQYGWKRV